MNLPDLTYGILHQGQYLYLFILSFNPEIFKLFELRHFVFLLIGVLLSAINARAVLPFLLIIFLDLDYSKMDKKLKRNIFIYFMVMVGIISIFGGVGSV